MNPIRFEIVILTYKRPQLLKECLESWLTQELSHTKIVVSDNSPDDLTKNLLESELTSAQKELFDYRKMNPPVDSLSHFEFCRQNVSADWYMLFHDDDVVVPNAWAKLKTTILEMHENEITRCSAIACSADILRSSGERHIIEKRKSLGPLKINSATEFIKHYCWPESSHPMFPVYLYQKQLVALIPFDNSSAGKYSDTTYLIRLLGQGYLLWLPIKLMLYRVHGSNDSSTHSLKDSLSLLNFVVKTDSKFYRSRDYQEYKHWSFLLHLRQMQRSGRWEKLSQSRRLKTCRHLARHFVFHPTGLIHKIYALIQRKLQFIWPSKT